MKIALSPCPNDTFLFYAWVAGEVGNHLRPEPTFGDIQYLNEWALSQTFPLIKLSFHCFKHVLKEYQLLPIGSALGFNCGPKIIAKEPFGLEELKDKTIAIPGKDTTAHLLLNHFFPDLTKKHFCLYHEIADCIAHNVADCGVIIHESRFTFANQGFCEIVDLGEMWHQQTNAPLPLGGLAIKRELSDSMKQEIVEILRLSLHFAQEHREKTYPFILHHSQDQNVSVVQQHIDTYVNRETEHLTDKGIKAIETLIGCPQSDDWLYSSHDIDCLCPGQ